MLLLLPQKATVPGGVDNLGGSNAMFASNISNTDDGRNYYGTYFQDDWKVTPKLTLNLGLRWDFFAQVEENFGAQANFIPGAPGAGAQYLIPVGRKDKPPLSTPATAGSNAFTALLAKDGIQLVYSDNPTLGVSQKTNFAPRIGFAYQATPKLVVRGGYGIFYGGFENRGYSPNIGENYPFQFNFQFFNPNDWTSIIYTNPDGSTCGIATIETGFSCTPLNPTLVNAKDLALRGIQFNYITPYTQAANLTLEYELTPTTALSLGYVGTFARHLETFPGSNQVSEILPPGLSQSDYSPFPDFGYNPSYAATEGNSYYHSLQLKVTRRFSNGLNFLGDYTYSKVRGDALDLLNGSGSGGYRAPYLPAFGIQGDYQLENFDVRNIVHFSGGYDLPIGQGKKYLSNNSRLANGILGGWSMNWILTLQDGQPVTVGCHGASTVTGLGCNALLVPGQNVFAGPHNVNQWANPKAFTNPPVATAIGQSDFAPLGGAPTQFAGPGFHRFDWSLFKDIRTSESTRRAEFFNLTNHPNFSGGNCMNTDFTSTLFGTTTCTKDSPNDPRQIQFALKFYF